jgi:hypothetical protein
MSIAFNRLSPPNAPPHQPLLGEGSAQRALHPTSSVLNQPCTRQPCTHQLPPSITNLFSRRYSTNRVRPSATLLSYVLDQPLSPTPTLGQHLLALRPSTCANLSPTSPSKKGTLVCRFLYHPCCPTNDTHLNQPLPTQLIRSCLAAAPARTSRSAQLFARAPSRSIPTRRSIQNRPNRERRLQAISFECSLVTHRLIACA